MNTRMKLDALLIGASLIAIMPVATYAQDPVVVETITATTYLNGGIGDQEEATMRRLAKEFPLRMTFSERKDGEYIADVPVVISDSHGNPVFETSKAGPMLDIILPKGAYKVSARFRGLTETHDVVLDGKDGKDLYFHWKGKSQ